MQRVITIGSATQDIFISHNMHADNEIHKADTDFLVLEEGSKIEVSALSYSVGGGAVNTATAFKKLGFSVKAVCKVDADEAGARIKEFLRRKDINFIGTASARAQTGTSFILPTVSGNRIIFAYRGANAELQFDEFEWELLEPRDIVYISSLSGNAATMLPRIVEHARPHAQFIANNPGMGQLYEAQALFAALAHIDIFILNGSEAAHWLQTIIAQGYKSAEFSAVKPTYNFSGAPQLFQKLLTVDGHLLTIEHYVSEILSRGPQIIVVTNGAEGVYVATKEKIIFHKSIPVKTVSTVGAGDAFGSSFVAAISQGSTIEQALVKGLLNSTAVLGFMSAQEGLLSRELLEERVAQFKPEIKTFAH